MWQDPKLEVVDTGFMFLCMKCCSDKKVVIMPYEKACCGCVNNRSTTCDSCFGLFGPIAVHIQSPFAACLFFGQRPLKLT